VTELVFDCVDATAERYAAQPTVNLKLRIAETTGTRIHAMALRCQVRIEPVMRTYSDAEGERLADLFGEKSRWGDTLKPMQLATVPVMAPGFTGNVDLDIPIVLTYDFEVATARYFSALSEGEVPLLLLFSGTVFTMTQAGMSVEQVPWHKECTYRMPVGVWADVMDSFFPDTAWLRLQRPSFDSLAAFRTRRALTSWEQTVEVLLKEAGEST
jgi:hypothetical protein